LQGDDDAVPIFKGVRKEDDDDDDDDEEEEEEGERTRAPEEAMEEERSIVIIIRGVRFFVSRTFRAARSVEFCKRSRKNGELENHHHFLGRRHKRYKKKSQIKVA
tara:strand:+ start:125 stop:439 length:315 start_codon:yes stop_codon:yes gene_type:complete